MRRRRTWISRASLFALLLGLAGTLAVLLVHLRGWDERPELQALDLRLRYLPGTAASGELVHVDIDDASLAELGRWPWPRARLAEIIDVLAEFGARAIALDVMLPEPQKTRYVSRAHELDAGEADLIAEAPPVPVLDDAILGRAIAEAGNVFLAMPLDFTPEVKAPLQAEVEEALVAEPAQTAESLAERLGQPIERIVPVLRRARAAAIDERVRRVFLRPGPHDFAGVLAEVLGGSAAQRITPEWEMAQEAYLRHRSLRALDRFALAVPQAGDLPIRGGRLAAPLVAFARGARGVGFVTAVPDADGVHRRVALVGRCEGRLYPQLALAVGADELARAQGGSYRLTADADAITIRLAEGISLSREIPVDGEGCMLIRWSSRGRHVPAAAVAAVAGERAKLARLEDLAHALRVKVLGMGRELPTEALSKAYWDYLGLTERFDAAYRARIAAERGRYQAELFRPSQPSGADGLAECQRAERDLERQAVEAARQLLDELRGEDKLTAFLGGADEPALAEARRTLELLDSLPAERERIQSSREALAAELRPLIEGKICMVGSTSTGAADIVPTPVATQTPGVAVHASALQTILSGEFLHPAGAAASVAAILAAGAIVSLIAALRPVVQAAALTALAITGYLGLNAAVVFAAWHICLVAVAPTAAMLVSFLLVTGYRQFTEERAKRRIRDMFAHALSPALVDRLLADPALAELGGQRRTVSCMFSDIAGFTPLSERLGPRDTVRLLNRYFDHMTGAIQTRGGGYLNKFLGDGIFAFFGAPVLQQDHPARSILAAVDCLAEVGRLNESLGPELGREVRLAVRIGIATGEAMVGNCGSSERMDYTAIGDCVNLASRLESACKFFGTRLLVTGRTWQLAARRDLLARPLGAVLVAGQARPVEVWNVLGPEGEATDPEREGIAEFTRALELFAGGGYAEARRLLEHVATQLGDDRPTRLFLKLARECAAEGSPDGWQGLDVKSNGIVRLEPWRPAAGGVTSCE